MQDITDFIQTPDSAISITVSTEGGEVTSAPLDSNTITKNQKCDILLSNFQIKKKQHRVLLSDDHIVWEPLEAKCSTTDSEFTLKKGDLTAKPNVIFITNLIRVSKGITKSDALRIIANQSNLELDANTTSRQELQQEETANIPPTEQYLVLSFAARIVKKATDCNRWEVRKLILYNADAYVVRQFYDLLNKILANMPSTFLRVRRLLVLINPYGGRKRGLYVYERHCKPLFQLAGIDASCIISQRSNQITDILLSQDLTKFDAVCCVGGDGTVAEVINGLIFRAICDAGMDLRQPSYVPKPALPIAIIPAGSTDTIAYSLHGTSDVCTAAIHLVLGQRRGMDICSIRSREGILRFCASLLSYGYLGDVAARSERYRWIGPKRYEFAGIKTFLTNKGYEADLRLLKPKYGIQEDAKKTRTSSRNSKETVIGKYDRFCYANCKRCDAAAASETKLVRKSMGNKKEDMKITTLENEEFPSPSNVSLKIWENNTYKDFHCIPSNEELTDDISAHQTIDFRGIKKLDFTGSENRSETGNQSERNHEMPMDDAINKFKNATDNAESCNLWEQINGTFFMITAANISCACTRSPNGVARYNHIGDGHMHLVLVRKTSLLNNVRLLLNMMSRNGDIRNLPFVETYRTKSFCFRSPTSNISEDYSISGSCQPITSAIRDNMEYGKTASHWNCDGEVINDQELTMNSHCQLIDVFMRGPHMYKKTPKTSKKSIFNCCCKC